MVNTKVTDLPASAILRAARKYPTPFFLYSEKKIRANCRAFKGAFRAFFPSFEPLYAVKANNNPRLLKIIFEEGFGADAARGSGGGRFAASARLASMTPTACLSMNNT